MKNREGLRQALRTYLSQYKASDLGTMVEDILVIVEQHIKVEE